MRDHDEAPVAEFGVDIQKRRTGAIARRHERITRIMDAPELTAPLVNVPALQWRRRRRVPEFRRAIAIMGCAMPATVRACAIEQLERSNFDGALVPDDAGEGVLEWVRRHGRTIPVIMVSEAADNELWIDVLNRGAADLIAKPVRPDQLRGTLSRMVSGRRVDSPKRPRPSRD